MRIANKQEFYKLSRAGLLGNILRQWDYFDFTSNRCVGPLGEPPTWNGKIPEVVGVRHVRKSFTNKGVSGLMPREEAYQYAVRCIKYDNESPDNLLFDEGAIHDRLTLQGEITTCEQHLYLRGSHLQVHQRSLWHIDANGFTGLKKYQLPHNRVQGPVVFHVVGATASEILKFYLDGPSWDKLNEILDDYPDCVVEFASFDRSIGVLGWNTVFWEVRQGY